MNIVGSEERRPQSPYDSFVAATGHMSVAMREVAFDLGGEELAARVDLIIITSDPAVPSAEALKMISDLDPEATQRILTRTEEIYEQARLSEFANVRRSGLRQYGSAILEGVASFNFSGVPPKIRH